MVAQRLLAILAVDPSRHPRQHLAVGPLADRHHQPSAGRELRAQARRNEGPARGHEDRVVRRPLGPTERAVAEQDLDVAVAKTLESRPRPRREDLDALDRDDVARDLRQHGGAVARAGPDLEHPLAAREQRCLGHERDDEGLRDGLPLADRQGSIFIGDVPSIFRDELVPRHLSHRREDLSIVYAPGGDLTIDHVPALRRVKIGLGHLRPPMRDRYLVHALQIVPKRARSRAS
jgi:hypothetical protein